MKKAFLIIALLLISFWCINVKADDAIEVIEQEEVAEVVEEKKEEQQVEQVEEVEEKKEELVVEEKIVEETKEEQVKVEEVKEEEKKEEPVVLKAAKAPKPKLTVTYNDTRVEGLDSLQKTYSLGTTSNDSRLYTYLQLPGYSDNKYNVEGTKDYYVFLGWYTSDGTKIPAKKANAMDIDGVKVYSYSDSALSWLYFDTTEVEEAKEINLYAKWSSKIYKATVDVYVYDDKAFNSNPAGHLSQWKKELPVTFTNGEGGQDTLFLDQIFDGSEYYTAFDNNSLSVSVKNSASYYKFKGWYDADGNEIKDGYTSNVIKSARVYDKGNQKKSLEITFKDALNANVTEDVDIKIYVKWEEFTTAILEHEYIDEVSTGSGSWKNDEGGTSSYTHTFTDPSKKTPKDHYEFLYWQHEDANDEQVDTSKKYKDGDEFTYSLSNKPSGWSGKVTTYAYWQPDVTLDLYDGDGKFISSESSFESVSINYDTTRVGYKFLGWFDANGNEVTETTFYPNEAGTKPEPKQITLYAKYEQILINVGVTKVWDDEDNQDGLRPDSIDVTLSNGTTVTLNEENKWSATVENVPEYKDGEKINYTWTEEAVDGYELTDTSVEDNITTLTNTHIPEMLEIIVNKVWADDDNESGKRPETVTVALVAGEEEVETVELNEEVKWTHTFKVPAYANGNKIEYEVREAEVPEGYEVSYEGSIEEGITIHNVLGQGDGEPEVEPEVPTNNPQTGDNIYLYLMTLIMSMSGLGVCVKKYAYEK